ncbi:MAG: GNAT family N-acetyltransferase [Gammaproteobacteria bacterium]
MNVTNIKNSILNSNYFQRKFTVRIVSDSKSITNCVKLRNKVLSDELNTDKFINTRQYKKDRFDDISKHLMVIEIATNRIVATTRLLSTTDSSYTGYFYSETQFDISNLHDLPGQILEIGRIYIDKKYQNAMVLRKILQGIAKLVSQKNIDYIIGCANIPQDSNEHDIDTLMSYLRSNYFSSKNNRVYPKVTMSTENGTNTDKVVLPSLLKGYIHKGAVVCGEPNWNEESGFANVFVLMDVEKINPRYFPQKLSA